MTKRLLAVDVVPDDGLDLPRVEDDNYDFGCLVAGCFGKMRA